MVNNTNTKYMTNTEGQLVTWLFIENCSLDICVIGENYFKRISVAVNQIIALTNGKLNYIKNFETLGICICS